MIISDDTRARASRLKLMAFDVDGVFTDNSLYYTDEGVEIKVFNARDGYGTHMLRQAGVQVAVITGRRARCVELRMENLGIKLLHQGVHYKLACMQKMLGELGLDIAEAGYMGDDLLDLELMQACGFSAAPADAHELVLRHARLISDKPGGRGAIRQVCEFILKSQGKLDEDFSAYRMALGQ